MAAATYRNRTNASSSDDYDFNPVRFRYFDAETGRSESIRGGGDRNGEMGFYEPQFVVSLSAIREWSSFAAPKPYRCVSRSGSDHVTGRGHRQRPDNILVAVKTQQRNICRFKELSGAAVRGSVNEE